MRGVHGRFSSVLLAVLMLGMGATVAFAQKAPAATPPPARDEAGLRQALKEYAAAVAKSDPAAMAEFWTPAGVFIDEQGKSSPARQLLEKSAAAKEPLASQTKLTPTGIRFLTADTATEDGTAEITTHGAVSRARYSAIWVRAGGKWKLDSLRESAASADTSTQQLAGLEPLVGKWTGQSGSATIQINSRWNANKTFLQREIAITQGGKVVYTAMQQVGRDPVRRQIRSWVFDGDGGYGEGLWSLEGNVWMISAKAVHPDGKTSKVTNIFKFTNRDTLVWRSLGAPMDGKESPPTELTLARGDKPPAGSNDGATPGGKAASPGNTPVNSADEAKKATLLASENWRRVESEFNTWAKSQVLYTPQQMEQTRVKLVTQIKSMSADELQTFIGELDGKLKKLLDKDSVEARNWVGQYLSVMADGYRQHFIGNVPNFADMTAAQMQDEYLQLKAKILSQQHAQAEFKSNESQLVQSGMKNIAAENRAAQQAAAAEDNAPASTIAQSHYKPKDYHSAPQLQFYEGFGGGISYALPGSGF